MSRHKFRPGLYSEVSSELINESSTKGKSSRSLEVNIDVLNDILSDLRHHADQKITTLTGSLAKKFHEYKKMVNLLHKTNTYSIIIELVKGHFSDIDEIIPGTIGAYCYGRFYQTKFDDDTVCSSIAAGSMPSVMGDLQECKYPTVIAEYNRTGYTLVPMRTLEKMDENTRHHSENIESSEYITSNESSNYKTMGSKRKGFVFVPHKSIDEFLGFSLSEKKKLKELGIDHVNLYGYSEDGKEHYKLASFDLDEMTCRKRHTKKRHHQKYILEDGWLIGSIVIFISILLIAGFLLSNKKRYGHL